jgi:hypothetical protein
VSEATKTPIWKRAALRGAGAFALLFVALEGLILAGKTTKIATMDALIISLVSGVGYAALWSVFAVAVAKALANVEKRAREQKP